MPSGILEVELINGQKLKSGDFFSKVDAYCIVRYGNHSARSNNARNQGSTPTWNQTFKFDVEYSPTDADDKHKIAITIMDEDLITADDELGSFEIDGKRIISMSMRSGSKEWNQDTYNVLRRNGKNNGEIRVGIRFMSN
ncbi:Elicitor-responsive protein [Thalictrum thalictroides]|uniref:Elicitor-responsive protein n=1 Tax=Thalictrum thalictroides TaxID=46969 RepID=A0A7J6VU38_THATH|nr:Elicitor-responsive protein [Thalictrum thalictroides]